VRPRGHSPYRIKIDEVSEALAAFGRSTLGKLVVRIA
jgi:hypothetical protein